MLIVPEEPDCETLPVSVLRVFDGDGFLAKVELPGVELELAVRMGFIDAPEMSQPGGKDARDFLRKVIDRKPIELIILTKMDTGKNLDRHGRVVAVPYIRGHPSNIASIPSTARSICRNVELEMIVNGWAWVLDRYCPAQTYFDALEDAQRNRRGIWAWDDNVHPWHFKTSRYRSQREVKNAAGKTCDLFKSLAHSPCGAPGCAGHLVERQGRFGKFYGCSRFPECRYSQSAKDK